MHVLQTHAQGLGTSNLQGCVRVHTHTHTHTNVGVHVRVHTHLQGAFTQGHLHTSGRAEGCELEPAKYGAWPAQVFLHAQRSQYGGSPYNTRNR
eukprot:586839-Pelagomonas_calceolata.AAC.1